MSTMLPNIYAGYIKTHFYHLPFQQFDPSVLETWRGSDSVDFGVYKPRSKTTEITWSNREYFGNLSPSF